MHIWLAVFLGGGLGSMMRYGVTRLVLALDLRGAFPYATLASNVLAAILLALLTLRLQSELAGRDALKAFLAIGICGGFSTFSTFSYENFLLLREGQFGFFALNTLLSVGACLLVFYLLARNA
jgi:fluoride exporter